MMIVTLKMQPSYLRTYHPNYIQSGKGLGNLFSSALKVAVPIFKKIVLPVARRGVRKVAPHALKLGQNVVGDVLSGQSVKKSIKRRAPQAALDLLTSSSPKKSKRTRKYKRNKRSSRRDIFSS